LNECINEINELITDKRFEGSMDECDEFNLDEIAQSSKMNPSRIMAVLVVLIQSKRICSLPGKKYKIQSL
jgi:hypothetical protein